MFKELSSIAQLMKSAKDMGGKMQEISLEMKSQRVKGTSAGGLIEIEANGLGEVLRVRIDESLDDREMIEDLLVAAINQANQKARQLNMETMSSATAGLPGLNDLLQKFAGEADAEKDNS